MVERKMREKSAKPSIAGSIPAVASETNEVAGARLKREGVSIPLRSGKKPGRQSTGLLVMRYGRLAG